MEKSNFVDQIRIFCRSGHGGAGSKHFMRTNTTPRQVRMEAMAVVVVIYSCEAIKIFGHFYTSGISRMYWQTTVRVVIKII
jgi:hypothetical protein